jgi:predicted lysophospholipase L1 biosynthesis ABC-type transport system permease subunit
VSTLQTYLPAAKAVAVVVLVLLALRYVLKIDVWYVLTGGVSWVLAVETGVVGFLLGWQFGRKKR